MTPGTIRISAERPMVRQVTGASGISVPRCCKPKLWQLPMPTCCLRNWRKMLWVMMADQQLVEDQVDPPMRRVGQLPSAHVHHQIDDEMG